MKLERVKLNFPATTAEDLADCFVSFYHAFPDAKNISLMNFDAKKHVIEISWDKEIKDGDEK